MCVARELTKKFEEIARGTASQMIDKFSKVKPKGEFVLVIEGEKAPEKAGIDPEMLVDDLIEAGIPKSNAVKIVAKRLKVPKNLLYRATLKD